MSFGNTARKTLRPRSKRGSEAKQYTPSTI
jgi:hypothetical protein